MTKQELIMQLIMLGYSKYPGDPDGWYQPSHLNNRWIHSTLPYINLELKNPNEIFIEGKYIVNISKKAGVSELPL